MKGSRAGIALSFFIISVVIAVILLSQYSKNGGETLSGKKEIQEISSTPLKPNEAMILVPAVDAKGEGKFTKFTIEATPGDGKTLANIDHLLFFVDTQFSIQTAKSVAANMTGIDISKYNLIYDIETETNETTAVEGPSAGAALTIATIAALENKKLDPEVMITGTINSDGTIGKIGGVAAKADAAREAGAKVFLVPRGQGLQSSSKVETKCEQIGRVKVCRTNYVPLVSVMTQNGLIIKEVANVQEALKYFIPNN